MKSQTLTDFAREVSQLAVDQVIALADLYAEQHSPSAFDIARRTILEAELDSREKPNEV